VTTELLIDAIVRQTTVFIAQLATAGGARTPIADVAEQVFLDLVRELDRQGVSRKVEADMFGMALRTFRRRIQRLSGSRTVSGRSLWEAIHAFIAELEVVTQSEILRHFHRDDDELARGVLQDLVETGLVYRTGKGGSAHFRAVRGSEMEHDDDEARREALDTLVAIIVYRIGPADVAKLRTAAGFPEGVLQGSLARLTEAGRIVVSGELYRAPSLVLPVGSTAGFEAAIFDHYQALVSTLCAKIREGQHARPDDRVGASTYTLELSEGHPFEDEVLGELARFRSRMSSLRGRIAEENRLHPLPPRQTKVTIYMGQNVIETGEDEEGECDGPAT
jgi:hypothetical protein